MSPGECRRAAPHLGTVWWRVAEVLREYPDAPAVHLLARHLPPAEMAQLHRTADCFVSLTRGGFWPGRAFDAAAAGKPVVVTGWGGQVDYLDADHPWLIDYVLEPVALAGPGPDFGVLPDALWAKADRAHAARLMRAIYDDRERAAALARARGNGIRARHEPLTVCSRLAELMDRQIEPGLAPENGTSYD